MDKAFEIIVKGRVQGVGYRYFVKQKADILGLNGWVKNKYDGTVEILVEGEQTKIEIFIDFCERGNSFSHIENLYTQEVPLVKINSFKINI